MEKRTCPGTIEEALGLTATWPMVQTECGVTTLRNRAFNRLEKATSPWNASRRNAIAVVPAWFC